MHEIENAPLDEGEVRSDGALKVADSVPPTPTRLTKRWYVCVVSDRGRILPLEFRQPCPSAENVSTSYQRYLQGVRHEPAANTACG